MHKKVAELVGRIGERRALPGSKGGVRNWKARSSQKEGSLYSKGR